MDKVNVSSWIFDGVGNIPSLPLFIGNYLLDLLSAFFPIFLILASINLVYLGFTRGNGDWKQTMQSIAPTITSIIVIMAILSMKTPYKENGGGAFWKDTHSYTIVEMLVTFIGFGEIFADALTHKLIYGTLDASEENVPNIDGYFPNFLQAVIVQGAKQSLEAKETFRKNEFNKIELENQILQNENQVTIVLKDLVNQMKEVGYFNNPHEVNYGLLGKNRFENIYIEQKNNHGFYLPNVKYGNGKNFTLETYMDLIESDDYGKVYDINKFITRSDKAFSMEPTFEFDIYMVNANYLRTKLEEYKLYKKEMDSENLMFEDEKKTYYTNKMKVIEKQISQSARFEKDIIKLLEEGYNVKHESIFKNELNIISPNYYQGLKENTVLPEVMFDELISKRNKMQKNNTFTTGYTIGDKERQYYEHIERVGNGLITNYVSKAIIVNELYVKMYNILKSEAKDRLDMQNNSTSIFANTFLSDDQLNQLIMIDGERMTLHKKYLDEATGQINVSKALEERLSKSENGTMDGELVRWTDLGKHYSTFKNLYSPLITSAIAEQELGKAKDFRNEKLVEFINDLEPQNKNERMSSAANWYAIGSFGVDVIKNIFSSKEDKKSPLTSLKDLVVTIGLMPILIFFINIILPSFLWMLVIISYYIEMSIYIAVFPIAFMFMVFQSYRQSFVQYVNVLIGFILLPIVLVSMYFVILYVDMLLPMFMFEFFPFLKGYNEFTNAFSSTMSGSLTNEVVSTLGGGLIAMFGTTIYTIINLILSSILLLSLFRANEYMSKILNVSVIGQDLFNGRDTINRFGSYNSQNLARV